MKFGVLRIVLNAKYLLPRIHAVTFGLGLFLSSLLSQAAWKIQNGSGNNAVAHVYDFKEVKPGPREEFRLAMEERKGRRHAKSLGLRLTRSESMHIANVISRAILYGQPFNAKLHGCKAWVVLQNEYGRKTFCDGNLEANVEVRKLLGDLALIANAGRGRKILSR